MIHPSFCYCFKEGDFTDNLKRLADCGFEGVEIWSYDLEARSIEETAQALSDSGIKCSQICPYFNFVESFDDWHESMEIGMRYIEYARALENPLVRVFTGPMAQERRVSGRTATIEQWDAAMRGLALLCAEAEKHDVRFCLEIHPGQLMEDSHSALKLINAVRSPSLVVNPQIPLMDEDPWYSLGRLAGHIGHFHAHNWSDEIGGTITFLPRGIFDWETYLRKALRDGFDGYVSIEHAPAIGDPWEVAEVNGAYLRELAGKLNE